MWTVKLAVLTFALTAAFCFGMVAYVPGNGHPDARLAAGLICLLMTAGLSIVTAISDYETKKLGGKG